jgi:hypothetical protein
MRYAEEPSEIIDALPGIVLVRCRVVVQSLRAQSDPVCIQDFIPVPRELERRVF